MNTLCWQLRKFMHGIMCLTHRCRNLKSRRNKKKNRILSWNNFHNESVKYFVFLNFNLRKKNTHFRKMTLQLPYSPIFCFSNDTQFITDRDRPLWFFTTNKNSVNHWVLDRKYQYFHYSNTTVCAYTCEKIIHDKMCISKMNLAKQF